jgi:hypothetical protein
VLKGENSQYRYKNLHNTDKRWIAGAHQRLVHATRASQRNRYDTDFGEQRFTRGIFDKQSIFTSGCPQFFYRKN